jgi:hypothetical protein
MKPAAADAQQGANVTARSSADRDTARAVEPARQLSSSSMCTARRVLGVLAAALLLAVGGLTFVVVPALAAAPEAPKAEPPTEVKAKTAVLNGVLDPLKKGEPGSFELGSYEFVYRQSASACKGAGEFKTAEGMSLGGGEEPISQPIEGLTQGTQYTFCVVAHNAAKTESEVSTPVTFTTRISPQTPEGQEAAEVKATTVTLKGVLNPKGKGEAGSYEFLYRVSGSECEGEGRAPTEPAGVALGHEKEAVSVKLTELQPSAKYEFCLLARNSGEETAVGVPVPFSTPAAPPAVSGEIATSVRSSETRIEATVNPDNELTECHIQYGTASLTEHEVPCEPEVLKGFGQDAVAATLTGLEANKPYQWLVITESEQSRKEGKPATGTVEHFTTKIPSETPETLVAQNKTGTTATFEGVLNPHHKGEAGIYTFVYRQSASECQGPGEESTPEHSSAGETPEPESEPVTALLPNTTYSYCLRTVNSVEEVAVGAPQTFTTPAVAAYVVGEAFFSNVGSSTATLQAKVNAGGAPTTFFFEYGATSAYGSKTPLESAGAAPTAVSVLANIEKLTPDTTYHFRVVASNAEGPAAEGEDTTFSTYPVSPLSLPDDRGYELVSPLSVGNDATVLPGRPTQAAADGSGVIYVGTAGPEGGNNKSPVTIGFVDQGSNTYRAKRSPTGAWTTENLQPNGLQTAVFEGFSSDLSQGFLSSEEPVFEGAPSGQALYSHDNTKTNSSYPLLAANASYAGSTANAGHVLFSSAGMLYDSVEGQQKTVNLLPDGTTASPPVFGSFDGDLENVISSDGSRIFWTTTETEALEQYPYSVTRAKALYVREDDTSPEPKTVQLDAAEPACLGEGKCVSGGGVFRGATPDGSRVFFTDGNRLTADSTATPEIPGTGGAPSTPAKPDLYEYDFDKPEGQRVTDLTPDTSEPADVAGVLGASEDGATVYFAAAAGMPATGARPQECIPATVNGETSASNNGTRCNVYEIHDAGTPKLVATVKAIDGFSYQVSSGVGAKLGGDWDPGLGLRSARVSADGQHLVFMSRESLTGFDSKGNIEIYIYDLGSGISCVSCNPSGAPSELETAETQASTRRLEYIVLPRSEQSMYALRDVSRDSDRVFFESDEQLVPALADANMPTPEYSNGLFNVYEWERDGSGSCATPGGCIYLLSGGTSADSSFFIDASVEGEDVFIGSRAQLVPEDHGEEFEVYDARIGAIPPPAAPACSGSGCQGVPPAPPIFATPSSVTFNGAGNFPSPPPVSAKAKTAAQVRAEKLAKALKACLRDKAKRKRSSCEKTARRRYGTAKASRAVRASNDRRAN